MVSIHCGGVAFFGQLILVVLHPVHLQEHIGIPLQINLGGFLNADDLTGVFEMDRRAKR